MFDKPVGDAKIPDKIDPRVIGVVLVAGVVVILTLLADRAVFVRAPVNIVESIISKPTAIAFLLLHDRAYANAIAAGFYSVIIIVAGMLAFNAITKYYIEPIAIKKMLAAQRREEKLVNKYREEDFH